MNYFEYSVTQVNPNEWAITTRKGKLSKRRWTTSREAGVFLANWISEQKALSEHQDNPLLQVDASQAIHWIKAWASLCEETNEQEELFRAACESAPESAEWCGRAC